MLLINFVKMPTTNLHTWIMKVTFITVIIAIQFCMTAIAQSHYATYLNDFEPFQHKATEIPHCDMQVSENMLIVCNNYSTDLIITDTIATGINKFKFYARIANLHNAENKSYKYTDIETQKTKKTSDTAFGIVWGYTDRKNFCAAMVKCLSRTPYNDFDTNRSMTINVIKVQNGETSIVKTVEMNDGIDLHTGYNVLNVEYDGNKTSIAIGNKVLRYIAEIDSTSYPANAQYGIIAGPASKLAIERIVLKKQPIMKYQLSTNWTLQTLKQHFDKSEDAYEGFWTFFDKDLDESKLKTGGRYTVALVRNGNGYDIIYVSGALVNRHEWTCGMLKGHISATQFIDNYNLTWYDAMMRPFSNDVYATIENYTLLSLHFTAQGSRIRFAKSL